MIKITFGEHDRCDDSIRPETRFVLRAISQKFSYSNFDNDIALLRTNDRVPITDHIRPICLPANKGKRKFQKKLFFSMHNDFAFWFFAAELYIGKTGVGKWI